MRWSFLLVVLVGCAADSEAPAPARTLQPAFDPALLGSEDEELDVCGLAAALSDDDICSLVCDPSAMAARLVEDGSERGACYQLRCSLTDETYVLVGVCLPP